AAGGRMQGDGQARRPATPASGPVVRRLFGDEHVVHVALAKTLTGNLDELRLLLQLGNRTRAGVTHSGAKTADELRDDRAHGAAMRNAPLDAFRDQLLVGCSGLPVAVAAALLHRAERAH